MHSLPVLATTAAVIVFLVALAWLAFRKDRHEARLDASMERCAGKPVDMTTRIWQDRSGRVMCENDPGRE